MSKTVDLSLSTRTRQYLIAGGFLAWIAVPVLVALVQAGAPSLLVVPAVFVIWLGLVVLVVRRLGGPGDGSTWDAVPSWQYDGRFAGAGGLVRDEQERALRDLEDE